MSLVSVFTSPMERSMFQLTQFSVQGVGIDGFTTAKECQLTVLRVGGIAKVIPILVCAVVVVVGSQMLDEKSALHAWSKKRGAD